MFTVPDGDDYKNELYENCPLYEKVFSKQYKTGDVSDLHTIYYGQDCLTKQRHYIDIYHQYFSKWRDKPVVVCEIGIQRGGSLKMWKKYFGKYSEIHGVDIDERTKQHADALNNIHVHIGDQGDGAFLDKLMKMIPQVDIFIDDGGHTTRQQIMTFLHCYDKISDNGIYLVEDCATSMLKDFNDYKENFIDFAKKHVALLYSWYREPYHYTKYRERSTRPSVVPYFTTITKGIYFHNEIVVFERGNMTMPYEEIK